MLRALDALPQTGIRWIGNANELCAGYAADGYARTAHMARLTLNSNTSRTSRIPRIGALFTTYGVGELSALNAVAGSYSEYVPLVHIVGAPSRRQWWEKPVIHHSLGNGRLDLWAEMAEKVTCAQADLRCEDPEEAVEKFDGVLRECVKLSRPVYVNLPVDMVGREVDSGALGRELLDEVGGEGGEGVVEQVVDEVVGRVRSAVKPLVIADGLSYPFDFATEINELVRQTQIPAMCFNAGKGIIDESLPSWQVNAEGYKVSSGGVDSSGAFETCAARRASLHVYTTFQGTITCLSSITNAVLLDRELLPAQPTLFTSADLVLLFGPLLSDTNTAAWSLVPDPERSISFGLREVNICGKPYEVDGKQVLASLVSRHQSEPHPRRATIPAQPWKKPVNIPASSPITQDTLWPRLSPYLLPLPPPPRHPPPRQRHPPNRRPFHPPPSPNPSNRLRNLVLHRLNAPLCARSRSREAGPQPPWANNPPRGRWKFPSDVPVYL